MRICFFGKPDAPQLRRVVKGLAGRGHEIRVVYRGPGDVPGARYSSFEVPPASLRLPYRWDGRQRRFLERILDDHDVVSIQFLHSWGFTPELMRRGCFTVRPWGSDITPPPGGPAPPAETLARRRQMLRCATAVSVTCDSFAESVAEFAGIEAAAIARTPLGVDLREFPPATPPGGPPVVGFLKGFGHAYGAAHLVRAIPQVTRAVPDVRFELVGTGPTHAECRELAQRLGIERCIHWRPRLEMEHVPAMISRWTLSVVPSICESFCIAALESAAMGVPIVAAHVGGLRETVLHDETGLLVPPADPDALAGAIIDLLCNDGRRCRLAANGRPFVAARFEWEKCMDAWEAFFHDADRRTQQSVYAPC